METQIEIWKDIQGYAGIYQVSNIGNVKNTTDIKMLKPQKATNGYRHVYLSAFGKAIKFFIHRLVASAFIPNPENKKTVNHINGIKHDNRVENLEWNTHSENIKHAFNTGLHVPTPLKGDKNGMAKLSEAHVIEIRTLSGKLSVNKIAEQFNTPASTIYKILNRETWQHI